MAKQINVEEATDWSQAELDENIAWLNTRGRSDLIAQIARMRETSPTDLTGEVDATTVRPDEETPSIAEREEAQQGIKQTVVATAEANAQADNDSNDAKKAKPDFENDTVDEIMGWVGSDKRRAKSALKAENEYENPRVTLVEQLEKILGD